MSTRSKRLSLFLVVAFVLGLFAVFTPAALAAPIEITVKFTDPNFKAAVYDAIGKTAPAPIYDTDVSGIKELKISNIEAQSLDGLEYFTGLMGLWCDDNQLTKLPDLPAGITTLLCGRNQLTTLPLLPGGLIQLSCNDNKLTSLPATLPVGLKKLHCERNQLTSLPLLPSGLTELGCNNNRLISLPALPNSITYLDCFSNRLIALPALPTGLTTILCYGNRLSALPTLPTGLKRLTCHSNRLTELPALPSDLIELNCSDNRLEALPTLPSSLTWIGCFNNHLTSLDVTGLTKLEAMNCSNNNMTDTSAVKGFTGTWDGTNYVFAPQNLAATPLIGLSSWTVAEVSSLNDRGVIPEALKKNFQKHITRDEFTALLVNVYEYTMGAVFEERTAFSDISTSNYKTAIEKAKTVGLIDGTSAAKFTPFGLLTREQTAKLLFTMVDKIDGANLDMGVPGFTDSIAISEWAIPYVVYTQRHNLMLGSNSGNFNPQGNLTREQAMLVAERLIVQYIW